MKKLNRNINPAAQHENGDRPEASPNDTEITINLAPFEFGVLSGVMKANGRASISEAAELVLSQSGICTALLNNGLLVDGQLEVA